MSSRRSDETPPLLRFDVFGRVFAAQRERKGWRIRAVGADGKLAHPGFVVPEFVQEHELEQYLEDLFHEWGRAGMSVRRIP